VEFPKGGKWNSLREGADPKMMWADSKTKNEKIVDTHKHINTTQYEQQWITPIATQYIIPAEYPNSELGSTNTVRSTN